MKYQSLFSGKYTKHISKCCLLKVLPIMLRVFIFLFFFFNFPQIQGLASQNISQKVATLIKCSAKSLREREKKTLENYPSYFEKIWQCFKLTILENSIILRRFGDVLNLSVFIHTLPTSSDG